MAEDSLALARRIAGELRQAFRAPALPFSLEEGEPGLTESKVGGTPYLPAGMPWPLDSQGEPLYFLMQVDCAALAPLPDFPHQGLLQWFVRGDDVFGMDFDNMCSGKGHRILYHPTADPGVTPEDIQARRPAPPEEDCSPLGDTPCRILFGAAETQPLPAADARFSAAFAQRWNQARPDQPIASLWDLCRELDLEEILAGEEKQVYHQMGGYPYFTQMDPREGGAYPQMDTLLMQLDSDMAGGRDRVLWGDCGIGNIFISRQDLLRLDFSRTGYNWDCC